MDANFLLAWGACCVIFLVLVVVPIAIAVQLNTWSRQAKTEGTWDEEQNKADRRLILIIILFALGFSILCVIILGPNTLM